VAVAVLFVGCSVIAVGKALDHWNGAPPPKPDAFGTVAEIGTQGDLPDHGLLFGGAFPNNGNTQARDLRRPARLSGYTVFVRAIDRVPANTFVDGYAGDYLRVHVSVFNRDLTNQNMGSDYFSVVASAGSRTPDVVGAASLPASSVMASGETLEGDLYLYVGETREGLFVVFDPPDLTSDAQGVWQVQ